MTKEIIGIIASQRKKFLDGLEANKGDINLDIFEDFYPDQAHFVFELLQNAEDAGATEASFSLLSDGCRFEHNGTRTFTEADVKAITGIHNSTKKKDADQIGKFGVGFKSVFVYTSTPVVHSGEFSFKIRKMVLPEAVNAEHEDTSKTRFWLPFNNAKKSTEEAFAEVENGLRKLSETTLLFLANLHSISWEINATERGGILRQQHSEHHFEVIKNADGKTTSSSHFLKFDQPIDGMDKQRTAIAYALDFLPGVRSFDARQALQKQLKIVETVGRVAVYFPAEKETSGLRFHLHAPFVPELSRASIKETPANTPLYQQLAQLVATSLVAIRDLGLLTLDFLAVLPNGHDSIPERYQPIRNEVVAAMKEQPLTPTHRKKYAPAKTLIQGKAALKELLSEDDLRYCVRRSGSLQWAVGATQKHTNIDRFLDALGIEEWNNDKFINFLRLNGSNIYQQSRSHSELEDWLSAKTVEWHQSFYALLYKELETDGSFHKLRQACIIKLGSGQYCIGSGCFFPTDIAEDKDVLPKVDPAVYSSGKSKQQQEHAKLFLEKMGVREVGEAEQIEAILKQRYSEASDIQNDKVYYADLRRFIAFLELNPSYAKTFHDYWLFERSDGKWARPGSVYMDQPFADTGLSAYYELMPNSGISGLAARYENGKMPLAKLTSFAKAVGVRTQLQLSKASCSANPQWDYLRSVGGERYTSPRDNDYDIIGLKGLLREPSLPLSRLIWRTMRKMPENYLYAEYRKNESAGSRYAESQLVLRAPVDGDHLFRLMTTTHSNR